MKFGFVVQIKFTEIAKVVGKDEFLKEV
jgi:hypothetical protein